MKNNRSSCRCLIRTNCLIWTYLWLLIGRHADVAVLGGRLVDASLSTTQELKAFSTATVLPDCNRGAVVLCFFYLVSFLIFPFPLSFGSKGQVSEALSRPLCVQTLQSSQSGQGFVWSSIAGQTLRIGQLAENPGASRLSFTFNYNSHLLPALKGAHFSSSSFIHYRAHFKMVGAIRKERMKASRPYERKVHFQQETSDIPITATPVRQAAPVLIPGAEDHKLQKRKGVSAARRRSGGLKSSLLPGEETDNIFAYATDPYPKTPVKKTRARARHPLATDMSIDKITASSKLQDFPSSPFGKSMGKPDVSDFSDIPRIAFLDTALPSSIEDIGSELEEMRSKIIEKGNGCRCVELEHENGELRRKYDALYSKHQTLLAILKEMRANTGLGGSLHAIEPQDEMLCDADDEFEQSQASMLSGYLRRSSFTPAPALASASSTPSTSSSSSSMAAEFGTPSETPTMPLRVIDEDYDEGYDRRSLRIEEVRSDVSRKLGLTEGMSMEETLDRLTDALSVKWRITDNSNIVIPPLTMPPLPDFQM